MSTTECHTILTGIRNIDIDQVRADTPACESVLHFNNAGASLMPQPVYDAVTRHLALENDLGGYEAAAAAQDQIEGFYPAMAALLNAQPDEIAYVESATRAWDMAFYALPLQQGDRILTHESEYASNYLAFLQVKQRTGVEIDLVPSDPSGRVDVSALESMVQSSTRLIALTHVPSQGGLVNPAAAVGQVARKHNLIYLLDACQSAGQISLDVKAIGCDLLTGTGRKFLRGPRGTGFLYVSRRILKDLHPPFIDLRAATWTGADTYELRDDAGRFEGWERYMAGQVGLAEAARYATALGLENIQHRVYTLAKTLRDRLNTLHGIHVHDLGEERCGIVTFTKKGQEPKAIAAALRDQHMNVSVTSAPTARLDFTQRGITALVRASVHYYNIEDEIDRFCEAVESLK